MQDPHTQPLDQCPQYLVVTTAKNQLYCNYTSSTNTHNDLCLCDRANTCCSTNFWIWDHMLVWIRQHSSTSTSCATSFKPIPSIPGQAQEVHSTLLVSIQWQHTPNLWLCGGKFILCRGRHLRSWELCLTGEAEVRWRSILAFVK